MRLLSALLCLLILVSASSAPAATSDPYGLSPSTDPMVLLFPEEENAPLKSKSEYAEMYYNACMKTGSAASMNATMDIQCTCTAANASEIMSPEEMHLLFSPSGKGRAQRARLIMTAYFPCMRDSIHEQMLNLCVNDEKNKSTLKNLDKVCGCIADGVSDIAMEAGPKFIPELQKSFSQGKELMINPLEAMLASDGLTSYHEYYTATCVQKEEYGY